MTKINALKEALSKRFKMTTVVCFLLRGRDYPCLLLKVRILLLNKRVKIVILLSSVVRR